MTSVCQFFIMPLMVLEWFKRFTRPASLTTSPIQALKGILSKPVDIAFLVYFRIAFGVIMMWEVWRYFSNGWIYRYWIEPTFHFTYFGFHWVRPLPGNGMYILWVLMGLLAFFIAIGLWYRLSTILFFLAFSYSFLLEATRYLNHFYLICLVSFVLIFLPANKAFSVDALNKPAIRQKFVPSWTLWLLRAQVGVAYFYGGLAKLNWDWLHGEPMRMWLANRADYPVVGDWFLTETAVYFFSYGGLLFDLLVVPALLWRRTRLPATLAVIFFHLTNAHLFHIGIFPWFMLAATPIFYPPQTISRLLGKLRLRTSGPTKPSTSFSVSRLTVWLFCGYLLFQFLFPLRHMLYPGSPSWTEEGHRFAWHMKLRSKSATAIFRVVDKASGAFVTVDPNDFLQSWQTRKMATRPDLILQFAHYLADQFHQQGWENVAVYAEVEASLNGRTAQPLIDPTCDLTQERPSLLPADWIIPLEISLNE